MTKNSKTKEKPTSKKLTKKSKVKKSNNKKSVSRTQEDDPEFNQMLYGKGEVEGMLGEAQPLFYYGPPPAIKALYRNTVYDKNFHPENLIEHLREGKTRSEIVASWGITYMTFNNWLDEKPELADALAVGKPAFDAYHKQALRHSAFGMNKRVRENSLFFLLKNIAGFDEQGGGHEFSDGSNAELDFVDE